MKIELYFSKSRVIAVRDLDVKEYILLHNIRPFYCGNLTKYRNKKKLVEDLGSSIEGGDHLEKELDALVFQSL